MDVVRPSVCLRYWSLLITAGVVVGLAASAWAEEPRPGVARSSDARTGGSRPRSIWEYPSTPRSNHVDHYHGVAISDPYRWLEDGGRAETRQWVAAQNQLTRQFLDQVPRRTAIRRRLEELSNYDRTSIPAQRAGRYFFLRNDGNGSQPRLHVAESLEAASRVLLDPNRLDAQGRVFLSGWRVSGDGKFLAYGLGRSGSDWRSLRIRDIDTGRDLGETLQWVKFSDIAWAADHRGFYYSRYPEPPRGEEHSAVQQAQKLYYHRLGDPQTADHLVYERPGQEDWAYDAEVTDDGRYLVIRVWRGTDRDNLILTKDLSSADSPVREVVGQFNAYYRLVGNEGPILWLLTDCDAPRGRVVAVHADGTCDAPFTTVIEASDDVLQEANVIGEKIVARYLHDAESRIRVFDLTGKREYELKFAESGTVEGFAGRRGDRESFFAFSNFLHPPTIYRFDTRTGDCTPTHVPRLAYRADAFETRRIFYTSRDGTRIPLTLVAARNLPVDGKRPTLLIGYGGFNVSLTPAFAVTNLVWLEMGGVLAIAHVRGGGEYGREWHDAGRRQNKQKGIDDFIGAAEWLIENRYTNPRKLAIAGKSNGGLLVGAAMTQRPELFAAALPGVGVLDMLRYQHFTIGRAWIPEYGVADNPAEFSILRAYSPLHNVHPGREYPATLITTADHDDRVVPAHSFKFAAELQSAQQLPASAGSTRPQDRLILLRVEQGAGHGTGRSAQQVIEGATDTLSFLSAILQLDP